MRLSVAFVTRELHPFVGGGIAPIIRATAHALGPHADVTLFTTSLHRAEHERRFADGELFPGVRLVFVEEPKEGTPGFYTFMQAWSRSVLHALLEHYADDGGPDLVEFPDYLGEGFVTIQAKRTGEPRLRDTRVCVRTHTTHAIVNVLNGHVEDDLQTKALHEMERYCIGHADTVLWPGGDVLATYRRYYGADGVAPAVELPDGFWIEPEHPAQPKADGGSLRLLYLGRFERRKGVQNLVKALVGLEFRDWELSMLGGDTQTGPLGRSMRAQVEYMSAAEERIQLLDPVPRSEVGRVIEAHDAIVVPSLWECWPNVVREAFLHDKPVLATPVGGLTAFVREGVSGHLASGTDVAALAALIEPHVRDPEPLRALGPGGGPRSVLDELASADRLVERYLRLAGEPVPRPRPRRRAPADVSIVVPYYRMDAFVEDTLGSIASQTYPLIETIVVNDGSLRRQDAMLEPLADRRQVRLLTRPNAGLGAARNFGIANARGRYVLSLDSDDLIEPDFVERCVAALEGDDRLAYVGTWSRFVEEDLTPIPEADPGYTPLGNWSSLMDELNVGGTATSLFRRRLFQDGLRYSEELASYEDWMLFRQLREAGRFGAIIPITLLRYRIRGTSMLRATGQHRWHRLLGEMTARLREEEMTWTRVNG